MIMAGEQKQEEQDHPELPEPIKAFWMLLNTMGGSISISQAHLEALPDEPPLKISWDPDTELWDFKIPRKRKRGIIKPSRRLILPS